MSLEKDINQTKFSSEYQKVIINIIYTANWIAEKTKSFFASENITQQQFNILRILRGAGKPISTLQIRERMLDKMSDTSRIVDRLVAKELVKKNTCPADKRLVDVFITAKGSKLLGRLDIQEEALNSICANLSSAEAKELNILLDTIRSSKS